MLVCFFGFLLLRGDFFFIHDKVVLLIDKFTWLGGEQYL